MSSFIIRVKAPLFTRVSIAAQISSGVTAGDIISKLQRRSRLNMDVIRRRFSSAAVESSYLESEHRDDVEVDCGEQFLFEVGGNIGNYLLTTCVLCDDE